MTDTKIQDVQSTSDDKNYLKLNAELNLFAEDENGVKYVQYEKDREAVRSYFLNHVNPNTVFFHSLEEKLDFLVENKYYKKEVLDQYDFAFIKKLYQQLYSHKFRFPNFVSALKYYRSYALKTNDKTRYLERFEDRVAIVALSIAHGNKKYALQLAEEMITGRFQPATPTFLNSGRARGGELVSCFLLNTGDDLTSILRTVANAGHLSKIGGGIAINLTNLRANGDPIKETADAARGVVPVMKIFENLGSYVDQLGQRAGALAVYLNALHWDMPEFLDTKRENADEKVRIKTLSIGIVIPDVVFELARTGEPMYLFSPYDLSKVYGKEMSWLDMTEIYKDAVNNPNIRKRKHDARKFLSTIAELQFESGYPYIMFQDEANRASQLPGFINQSNLCVEILQPQTPSTMKEDQTYDVVGKDISCNLGSMNVLKVVQSPDLGKTIETAMRALHQVSVDSNIVTVPTVKNGNEQSRAVGLGIMNLHGAYVHYKMYYGEEEALDFANMFMYAVNYHSLRASMLIAKETGKRFDSFNESKYATGEYFERFINPADKKMFTPRTKKVARIFKDEDIFLPAKEDWEELARLVKRHGLANSHRLALAPTGSISYVQHSTASFLPVAVPGGLVEQRAEGQLGNVYAASPHAEGNEEYYQGHDMFSIDPKKVVDTASVLQFYVDQGMSLTLGYKSSATTKNVVQTLGYAYSKGKPSDKELDERGRMLAQFPQAGIKTLYYVRILNENLEELQNQECVSCSI